MSDTEKQKSLSPSVLKRKYWPIIQKNLITILTAFSVVLGFIIGIILRKSEKKWTERELMYLEFPGEMFMRSLMCLIIPIIFSSLVTVMGSSGSTFAGKIGGRTAVYYLSTTIIACFLGIVLVLSISPGTRGSKSLNTTASQTPKEDSNKKITTADTVLDLIRNLVPSNLIEATLFKYTTVLTSPDDIESKNDINKWKISHEMDEGSNIIGLVMFAIILGLICGSMGDAGKPIVDLFACLSEASMKMISYIIMSAPIGIMFLVIPRIVEVEDVHQLLGSVGWFMLTVLSGLFIHGLIILPSIYYLFIRKNPFKHLANMSAALVTAFGTSSSSATLPVTIKCMEDNCKLDIRISRFVLPLGATVNMDGEALYEAVAAIFIAQLSGRHLTLAQVIIVSIISTLASIGAAGIPSAGVVTVIIILNAVGLPADNAALILVVDWFLDRFRTAINVLGDSVGAALVSHWCQDDLLPDEPTKRETHEMPEHNGSARTVRTESLTSL